MRIFDPAKGAGEASGIIHLLQVNDIGTVDAAMAVLARYFPKTAQAGDKQRFLLKHLLASRRTSPDAPVYPA